VTPPWNGSRWRRVFARGADLFRRGGGGAVGGGFVGAGRFGLHWRRPGQPPAVLGMRRALHQSDEQDREQDEADYADHEIADHALMLLPGRISAKGFTIRDIRLSPDGEMPSLGYLPGMGIETIGLIIGVLFWYGVSKVLLTDHADQFRRNSRHQPKGKK
jgi:hypothetical protein